MSGFTSNTLLTPKQDKLIVYFDLRTHACACVHMVENNEKHSKIMKKYLFYHAHERLM